MVVLVVGALLVQPPNSSSADTLGATENPPEAPGTIGWLAKEVLPELPQPKSFTGAGASGGAVLVMTGLCCLVASGLDHALPQTSAPDKPLDPKEPIEPIGFEEAAGVTTGAAGLERLKTEEDEVEDIGAMAGWCAGATRGGDAADEKSNKSPSPDEAGAGVGLGPTDCDAKGEVMPPKPNGLPIDCFGWCAATAGFASKKLPPLRLEKADWLGGGVGREDEKLPRPAKASFWGDFIGGELAKLKPLKASLSPPKAP